MDEQQGWERKTLEKLATSALVEQRSARHWKIFFRLIWVFIIVAIVSSFAFNKKIGGEDQLSLTDGPYTAVIDLKGEISSSKFNSYNFIHSLQEAYSDTGTQAIIIRANSPGGSPVLSGQAFDEIIRLKKQYPKIPIYTVVEDVCASGCYYIASATDKIYVDKASMVGSIGVLMNGFGFVDAMQKLGIERRLYTAGKNKGMGDPFSPSTPEQQAMITNMLEDIHQQFIAAVKLGRGNRLHNDPDIFSGRIYIGTQANQLGLSDGFGSVSSVARDVIKVENIKNFTQKESFAQRLAHRFGTSVGDTLHNMFETRLM